MSQEEKQLKRFLSETLEEYEEEDFADLDLSRQTVMSNRFYECSFKNCDLSEAVLQECRFVDCTFSICNLSMIAFKNDCTFLDTSFLGSKMIGINWPNVSWPNVQPSSPLMFDDCDISFSSFGGLTLKEIAITKCRARDVDFQDAIMAESDFADTDLMRSLFNHTDLTEANFVTATNYSIDVRSNRVKGARFSLPEAANLLYMLDIEIVDE